MTINTNCTPTTITTGVVQFSAPEFLACYPQFMPQSAFLPNNFTLATTQLNNTCGCDASGGSLVQDANLRQTLLYLLTAHITQLLNGVGSTPATGLVGRVSDGSEGSVSVSTEYDASGGPSQAYYLQTPFGVTFWQATAPFRQARYIPECRSAPFEDFGLGRGLGFGLYGGTGGNGY